MAHGTDAAALKDLLAGQLELARQVIADVKFSPRDPEQRRRICEQVIAGLTLAVGVLISREWRNLTHEEGMRLRQVYGGAVNALRMEAE